MKKNVFSLLLVLFMLFLILTGCSNPAGGGSDLTGEGTDITVEPGPSEPDTFYVIAGGKGNKDGSSWENAYADLQTAIDAAASIATIVSPKYVLILGGYTYYPNSSPNILSPASDREKHFSLKNYVTVIGGFKGDEPDRIPKGEATVLSGDIGVKDNKSDNGYHVFYHFFGETDLNSTAVLRNVTITGGNADRVSSLYNGGGMFNYNSSPTIENCTFINNSVSDGGGGMYNVNSSPTVKNCTFSNNSAYDGGGMYNVNSSPTVKNCTFSNNSAYDGGGISGGMYNYNSSPTLENCTFSNNSAYGGGGMLNWNNSSPMLINCTFSNNNAHDGGGMYNANSSPTVENCTFSNNSAYDGGGMYNDNSSSPTVENCTFSGNNASNSGGGMCNENSDPTVENCTFSGNNATALGGGMYNRASSSPKVYGSILVGNFKTGDGSINEISGNALDPISTANLIRGTTANQHNAYGTTFTGDISMIFAHIKDGKAELKNNGGPTETLMIKKDGSAYNKITTSPAWLPPKDQRGFGRTGTAADIGAVEWQAGDPE